MASNSETLNDEDGDSSDWLEIYNAGTSAVSLNEWYLTDDMAWLDKWQFPDVTLDAGGFLVVFASGKDRAEAGSELHTNFNMDSNGEYLALVMADGETIAHEFFPTYPRQRLDISYGMLMSVSEFVLKGDDADVLIPSDGNLGDTWMLPAFNPDAAWISGTTGVGFKTDGDGGDYPEPKGFWNLEGQVADQVNANHGSFVGGTPIYVEGFEGTAAGALSFDGNNDYIEIAQASGLPAYDNDAFTIAMWVKGLPQNDNRVYSEGSSSSNNPLFTIGTDNNGSTGAVDIYIRSNSGGSIVNHAKSNGVAFDGTWHHIAWVDEGGTAALYIDGVRDSKNFNYTKQSLDLDVTSIGAVLRGSACCFFNGSIDDVAVWDVVLTPEEIAELAAGTSPGGGSSYGALVETDLEGDMFDVNASAYIRVPFQADNPDQLDSLILRMKYDDGFVAYLNGQEVARRNAPGSTPWNASASSERDPIASKIYETINLTDHRDALVDGDNVLAIHGLNLAPDDEEFLIVPELVGSSALGYEPYYFSSPTPGSANAGGIIDFVADTQFSIDRGHYEEPFDVEITTLTEGATIRYTTDGSEPTTGNGTTYTGPIAINTTTVLRAFAYKAGYMPTNVDAQTYIFLDDVLNQPHGPPPGYPTSWGGGFHDYGMDPEICTNTNSPHYEPTIKEDMQAVPIWSLALSRDDFMGSSRGIYTHPTSRGLAWERSGSLEIIYPDDPGDNEQLCCGIRMQGGSSARTVEGKHSFRLLFKRDYGPSRLRHNVFPDSDINDFNTITLRCCSTDSWHFKDGGSRYRRWDSQYIRDVWMRDSQLDMGQPSSHGSYVHLYVNGLYWGLYNPTERPDEDFQVSYQGDSEEDWDIVKDFNELFRGNRTAWTELMNQCAAGLSTTAAYQRIQGNNPDGTPNPSYPPMIDVDNIIDYMILHLYGCAEDWPHHNWYGARSRTGNLGGWRFFSWDQEITMDFVFRNRISVSNDNSPARVYSALRANPDFRMRFADRVQMHMFNGGALTNERARERWMKRADQIDRAIVGESARWGDFRDDHPDPGNTAAELYTRDGHWLVEQEKVLNTYIPESHRLAIERFQSGNLYPHVSPPVFSRQGGIIEEGFRLGMSTTEGTIYYTLNGTDPRLPGGDISPDALIAGHGAVNTLVASGADVRLLVPTDDTLGMDWIAPGFDDDGWTLGQTGVGYERSSGFEDHIETDLEDLMYGENGSVYMRIRFDVDDPGEVEQFRLLMKYDDGFVAYINGQEVESMNAPDEPVWNSTAAASHADGSAVVFEYFDLTDHIGLLQAGTNVLAVHGMNVTVSSTDMLIVPELVSTEQSETSGVLIPETMTVVKARALGAEWSALNEDLFYHDIPLRITELNFHPRDPEEGSLFGDDDFEFIELQNVGDVNVNLDGIRLVGGVYYEFPVFVLNPGEVVVIAGNIQAFIERYGVAGRNLIGEYARQLGNAGDDLFLEGPLGEPILDFEYVDTWYPLTDGQGPTLVIKDPLYAPEAWQAQESWAESEVMDGTPGSVDGWEPPTGGWQMVGDMNQDGKVDLSDVVRSLMYLFGDMPVSLPCEAELSGPGNMTLLDLNDDGKVDLADQIYLLAYLFSSGPDPVNGVGCRRVDGCPHVCQ